MEGCEQTIRRRSFISYRHEPHGLSVASYLHFAHLTNCVVVHSKLPGDGKCLLVGRVLQDVVGGEAPDQVALDCSREGHMRMDRFRIGLDLPTTDPTAQSPHLHRITAHAW